MANQGPKSGECGHFRRTKAEEVGDQSYAIARFTDEVNRLYGVMNNRLYDRRYLAGDEYSIADMISYPWCVSWEVQGQDIEEFPYCKRWFEELGARQVERRPALDEGQRANGFIRERSAVREDAQLVLRRLAVDEEAERGEHGLDLLDDRVLDILRRGAAIQDGIEPIGPVLVGRDGLVDLQRLRNETVQALGYDNYFAYQVSDYNMTPQELRDLMAYLMRK